MLVEPSLEVRPYEVLKWTPRERRSLLVLSAFVGLQVHFLGSSKICAGTLCPACRSGVPAKFAGYVAVLSESMVRLLRLTHYSAYYGVENGLFVPGLVIEAVKPREKRPLTLLSLGKAPSFQVSSVISRVELLSVIAALHGLPRLPDGVSFESGQEIVARNAAREAGLAMKGVYG